MELFQYCATNNYKEQCFVFEKLWSMNAFDFVYSPVDMSFILSNKKNFEDLGIIAMEAIKPQNNPPLPPTNPKLLIEQVKTDKVN